MFNTLKNAIALTLIAAVILTGCLGAGVDPQNPKEKLVTIDRQFTALVETAIKLRKRGIIQGDLEDRIGSLVNQGNAALDAAWSAHRANKAETALDRIQHVNDLMRDLSRALKEAKHNDTAASSQGAGSRGDRRPAK